MLRAQALVAGHGRGTAGIFDIGHSRVLPWPRRPEAARLIDAPEDPGRNFDVLVIGSSEAFYGSQCATSKPIPSRRIPKWQPFIHRTRLALG